MNDFVEAVINPEVTKEDSARGIETRFRIQFAQYSAQARQTPQSVELTITNNSDDSARDIFQRPLKIRRIQDNCSKQIPVASISKLVPGRRNADYIDFAIGVIFSEICAVQADAHFLEIYNRNIPEYRMLLSHMGFTNYYDILYRKNVQDRIPILPVYVFRQL